MPKIISQTISLAVTEVERKGIEGYDAVLLSGKADILRGRYSDLSIEIPSGIRDILWRKVHTIFSKQDMLIPEEESIIAPPVEVHIKRLKIGQSGKGTERHFVLKIPHCLETEEERSGVVLRYGDVKTRKLKQMKWKKEFENRGTGPYYDVDSSHIIVHASHFCFLIPSFIRRKFMSHIRAFSSVALNQRINNITNVTVKIYLCPTWYKIKDFRKVNTHSVL